jgi:hypothetical protein
MTSSESKKLSKILKAAYKSAETQAKARGMDLNSQEFKDLKEKIKATIIKEMGYSSREVMPEKELDLETVEKVTRIPFSKEMKKMAEEAALKAIKDLVPEPNVVNNIVDYNDAPLRNEIDGLKKRIGAIPPPPSIVEMEERLKGELLNQMKIDVKANLDVMGMPDFRKLGMGLQEQIDDLRTNSSSGSGDMVAATYDPAGIEEQLVGLTAAQTLTNKTLTAPKINENVAITATSTELNYTDGVTSAIQTQIDGKQPLDADLTAIAALTTTAYGRGLLALADEDALEATLDTLPNLTSIQGRTVTLADAGADALLGWDDSASAYENMTQAEVLAIIGDSSETAKGVVELATNAETVTGTDTARATTPANITAKMAAPGAIGGTTPSTATFTTVTINTGITLAENSSIALDPAGSADGKYTGITIAGTAGATLAFGDLVYLAAADSRWELADADSATTADRMLGMCVLAAASDGDPTVLLLMGQIRADAAFPALTIGSAVYVGETAGDIQTAIPTGADNVIRRVGYALTADEIYFNPSQDVQTVVA